MNLWLALAFLVAPAAEPCAGVDRALDEAERPGLVALAARQLEVRGVAVHASLRSGDWRVLQVTARNMDESYVFWSGDPHSQRFVEAIGSFALPQGEAATARWLVENVPGIPKPLAACVAALAAAR
ncbi:hypothetical protein [Tahibacter harae]|uniref:Uncharacterized protein n=1 Tax=Tahibacter harae TaxID=2963937 RepID=A0ABT1QNV2_9GAMM|nr:hypothetical protein [Tahibacter harae]MCQ4163307.1 hypothetical protein [Tahibacter harae]